MARFAPDPLNYAPSYGDNPVGRVTTFAYQYATLRTNETGGGSSHFTMTSDYAMWFTGYGPTTLGRIDMSRAVTSVPLKVSTGYGMSDISGTPYDLATGPDGAIWFTESGVDKIGRLSFLLNGVGGGSATEVQPRSAAKWNADTKAAVSLTPSSPSPRYGPTAWITPLERQLAGRCHRRPAGRDRAIAGDQGVALRFQVRAGGAGDGRRDPAAVRQVAVGGVHDRVDRFAQQVGLHQGEGFPAGEGFATQFGLVGEKVQNWPCQGDRFPFFARSGSSGGARRELRCKAAGEV